MATELRRRKGRKSETIADDVTPARDESPVKTGDKVKIVHPKRKRNIGAIFLLGSLFGILAAGFFAKSNDLIDFPELGDLSVDSILDVLPAGLVKDYRELVVRERATAGFFLFPSAASEKRY